MIAKDAEALFAYICQHIQTYNRPPTLREMSKALYMSTSRIYRCLDTLEAKGWIEREPGQARGITLVKRCKEKAATPSLQKTT